MKELLTSFLITTGVLGTIILLLYSISTNSVGVLIGSLVFAGVMYLAIKGLL